MLFDTGGSGDVLLHNLAAVQVAPQSISALALSHAHRDHTGGLPALLARRAGLPLYAHPDLFRERFSQHGAEMRSVGMPLNQEDLGQVADLSLSDEPQEILPGVWASGEITGRDEPEGRSSHHFIRQGEALVADPYRDDMSLLLETGAGLVLICGCCHAGLLNTLAQVWQAFGRDPVVVMGGTHLISADEEQLHHLVEVLGQMGPPALYPNHCTGQAAYVALARAFGERVSPCPAGTVLEF